MQTYAWLTRLSSKPYVLALTIVLAVVAIATPILFALHQARDQGLHAAQERALYYARDVIYRSDKTADQVSQGIAKLIKEGNPCSEASLSLMREIDLSSSYIQAIGYTSDNNLICSSLGLPEGISLGAPDYISVRGTIVRTNVKLPFTPAASFIVLEQKNYAAIIHKDLPLDTTTTENNVALAIFATDNKKILSEHGIIAPEWINKKITETEITFLDQGYVVARVNSTRYIATALAAVPVTFVNQQTDAVAILLVPIGIIFGLILTIAIVALARLQLSIPATIKAGLRRNEFFLDYQPIVNLQNGKWVGAEALIRWRRTGSEIIGPDFFIPIAEKSGLIHRITERVLELIAEDIGDLFKHYPDFHIAINLSSMDMQTSNTMTLLNQLMKKTGAGPNNLIVEATERGIMDAGKANQLINDMHAQGINIAIDDFGTGYSSLAYLQTFKLDLLKIDKSFVNTIGTEALTSQVVQHIIEMAKDLNLKMVAEGVETELQAEFLRARGVEYAQGWLFGRPTAITIIRQKLDENNNGH